jgi:serine/threonine protein kinase
VVPVSVFRLFVSALAGDSIEITQDTFSGLSQLSDEFGFEALALRLSTFSRGFGSCKIGSRLSSLEGRLTALERRFAGFEQTICRASDFQTLALKKSESGLAHVTAEVKALSPLVSNQIARLESQSRKREVEIADLQSELSILKSRLSPILRPESGRSGCRKENELWLRMFRFLAPADRFSDRRRSLRSDTCDAEHFIATDASTNKRVWVHVRKNRDFPVPDDVFRALEILAGNNHPTILRLVGFSLDGHGDIATEFHENGDLESALSGAGLNARQKSKIVFGIVCGMACLHSQGISHRAIRPAHILLDERLEPVIGGFVLDFDTAFCYYSDHMLFLPCRFNRGVPVQYRAPELKPGELNDRLDQFSADVFSFGMTLYTIFGPLNTCDYRRQFARCWRSEKHPNIPDYHWDVITRCCSAYPESRPQFGELLNDFLISHGYILPGADESSVFEYERRVFGFRE